MTRVVYKENLELIDGIQTRHMSQTARILHVHTQNDYFPTLWYEHHSEEAVMVDRKFRIFGTGHPIPADEGYYMYLGTCYTHNDQMVWHVYELLEQAYSIVRTRKEKLV